MRLRVILLATIVVLFCATVPAQAEQGDMRWQFGLVSSTPTDDLSEPGETLEASDAFGFQTSFEYMVTDKLGLEPALTLGNHDIEVSDAVVPDFDLGDVDFFALMANLNFYVVQKDGLDLYVGPTVGMIFWDDFETDLFGPTQKVGTDDEFAYGVNAGLNVPFGGDKWAFSASLGYLIYELTLEDGTEDLGIDPIQLKAGVSYKF